MNNEIYFTVNGFPFKLNFEKKELSTLRLISCIKLIDVDGSFGMNSIMGFISEDDILSILNKRKYSLNRMNAFVDAMSEAMVFSQDSRFKSRHQIVRGGHYEAGKGFLLHLHEDNCRDEIPVLCNAINEALSSGEISLEP